MPSVRPKRYICSEPGCGKAYNRPVLLRQHERSHTNDRPFACTFEGCNKTFLRKSHLQVHELFHKSDSEKPFRCPVCGKGTISPQLLKRHELTHTKKHKCNYPGCTEAYFHFQSLKHHVDTVHEQVLTCGHCNRQFQLPAILTAHKLKVHGEATVFQCEHSGCFTTFKDKKALKKHINQEHPVFKCQQCELSVTGATEFNLHLKTHQNLAAVELWRCKRCEGTVQFVKKAELIKHYHDIHNGDFPHDILDAHDQIQLHNFLKQAKADSLKTMTRENQKFTLAEEPESESPELDKALVERTVPDKSIINLVLGNTQKTHVCPKKNCGRKFTRIHAYKKHLRWHEIHLAKIEEFLHMLEAQAGEPATRDAHPKQAGAGSEGSGLEQDDSDYLDNFSDDSDGSDPDS